MSSRNIIQALPAGLSLNLSANRFRPISALRDMGPGFRPLHREKNMFYVKNVPAFERILRLSLGAATIFLGFWIDKGPMVTGMVVGSGFIAALTGLIGFCPMCALVGRKLDKGQKGR